ncbi:MAG TPA: hypothetical protein VFV33_26370 [Gemmatimonadaceae bacterium]|nr:hypothetical protein [Gemmatimonadaceae bacterium]
MTHTPDGHQFVERERHVERVNEGADMDQIEQGMRRTQGASLSVVLLSEGDCTALERALSCIASPCRRLDAEIVVVRATRPEPQLALDAAYPSVLFIEVSPSSTLSERREIGISRAAGDIVAVKIDGDVDDSGWLNAFERVVGANEEIPLLDREATSAAARGDESSDRRRPRGARAGGPVAPRRDRPMSTAAAEGLLSHATVEPSLVRAREM